MTTITINPNLTLHLPDGYVPPPLPMRDEWIADLRSGAHIQCPYRLHDGVGYCCLGRLSALQGRLTRMPDTAWCDADLGDGISVDEGLSRSNPLFPALRCTGNFPPGVTCEAPDETYRSLASLNDDDVSFADIATVIETLWSQPEL